MRILYLFLLFLTLNIEVFSVELSSRQEIEFNEERDIADFSIILDNDMVHLFTYVGDVEQSQTAYYLKAHSYDNELNLVVSNEADTVGYISNYPFKINGAYTNSKNTRYYIFHTGSSKNGDTLYIDNTILDTNLNYVYKYKDSVLYDPSMHTFVYNGKVGLISYSRSNDKIRIDEYLTSLKYDKTNYNPSHNFKIKYEDSDSVKYGAIGQGGLFGRKIMYYSIIYQEDSVRSSGIYLNDYDELQSHKSYGNIIAEKVAIGNQLNIYTVFRKKNTISKTIYILYKTDDQSSVKWKKEFGYGNSDNIYDLAVDAENNAYILMHSKNKHKILKFSETGDKVWEYELDVNDLDYSSVRPKGLDILSGDELLISYFVGQNGSDKILLEKYQKLTDLKTKSSTPEQFVISPNPAQEFITLLYHKISGNINSESNNIMVYNTLGELVLEEKRIPASKQKINISSLQKGVYYLRVGNITKKFIIH